MSWQVHCLENTTQFPEKNAALFKKVARHTDLDEDELHDEGGLTFDEDHQEHIDWINKDKKTIEQLWSGVGVRGRVLFGSLEGDNAGEFWGYDFTNEGWSLLKGRLKWRPKTLK